MDREEAGMLDFFLKNSLNVAESKFSTAKHLHDVCWGMEIEIYCKDRIYFSPDHIFKETEKDAWQFGLNNKS